MWSSCVWLGQQKQATPAPNAGARSSESLTECLPNVNKGTDINRPGRSTNTVTPTPTPTPAHTHSSIEAIIIPAALLQPQLSCLLLPLQETCNSRRFVVLAFSCTIYITRPKASALAAVPATAPATLALYLALP